MKPKCLLALGVLLVGVTAAASLTGAQKSALPQPTEQQKLKERVDALESQLKEAQAKADRASMEKDYITRVQKQYETYYKEVLSTQSWTLGIFGLILTVLFGLASKFSLDIFDSRTKSALDAALAQVEKKFSEQMQKELETLRQQNTAQLKALQDGLTKRIIEQEKDLKTRSDFQFHLARGLAAGADKRHDDARHNFRQALATYKSAKPRQLIETEAGVTAARNIFVALLQEDEANHAENARKELADQLYNGLEEELALAALDLTWLAPLLQERT